MNIYLLTRPENMPPDLDEWTGAVVAAESEDRARMIHPGGHEKTWPGWIPPAKVIVRKIGVAEPDIAAGVLMEDFCAG